MAEVLTRAEWSQEARAVERGAGGGEGVRMRIGVELKRACRRRRGGERSRRSRADCTVVAVASRRRLPRVSPRQAALLLLSLVSLAVAAARKQRDRHDRAAVCARRAPRVPLRRHERARVPHAQEQRLQLCMYVNESSKRLGARASRRRHRRFQNETDIVIRLFARRYLSRVGGSPERTAPSSGMTRHASVSLGVSVDRPRPPLFLPRRATTMMTTTATMTHRDDAHRRRQDARLLCDHVRRACVRAQDGARGRHER